MALTQEDAVARARALAPGIAARAAETEAKRAPHDDTIRELVDAGLLSLLVPARWGGPELGLGAMLEVVETISAACMSSGWIAAFYIGHNALAARLSEKAQAEIFADRPLALMPGSMAPTLQAKAVTGGFEVSGRAAWASGVMHADWVLMGGLSEAGPYMFLIPIEDIEVEDTWHMSGMSGTGSNDMVAREVFVPEHRAEHALGFGSGKTAGAAVHPNPIYGMPFMPFVQCETLGVYSGGLRGATAAFEATVRSRVRGHTGAAVRDQPLAHLQLGGAHVQAEVAEALARGHLRRVEALLAAGAFTMADRVQLRAHAGFVVDHCRRATNELMSQSGSSAFRCDLPLQRFFRDMNMLATHAFFEWDTSREQYGRGKLGLEPTHPLL